jgi:hypothetical protein
VDPAHVNGHHIALDGVTGHLRWSYATGDAVDSSPEVSEGGRTVTSTSPPTWVTRTSDSLYQGAAQIYSIAYKAEIGATLIKLTQVLGGTTAGAASVISRIPDRKAAAILESMERSKALLILREMDSRKRRPVMEHMSSDIRYLMAADDYNGSK